jgi:1-acyl-sn-glycerol-3-phosphate acyltransferase
MADAKVIAMNGERAKTPGARSMLAGAERASGERTRRQRQTTPLLAERGSAEPPAKKTPAAVKAATKSAPAPKAPVGRAPAKQAPAQKTPVKKDSVRRVPTESTPAKPTRRAKATKAPTLRTGSAGKPALRAAPLSSRPIQPVEPPLVQPAPAAREQELPTGGRHSIARALVSQAGEALLEALTSRARPAQIEAKVGSVLGFLRRRLAGEYELDEFGFDQEFTETIPLALLRPLYRHWFRVDVRGIENLPLTGGALIVANHSGGLPMDALMTGVAVHEEHPQHRFLRTLGADLVFQTPFLAGFARRSGSTLASNPDAEGLLAQGHLVGVWPEGFKGIGKPFTERYKLQRFGRGGFVSAALRTGTPIIPCSIVGAEEIYPIIGNVPSLARLLGLPYLPITPFFPLLGPLGAIPLPSKWLIEFGPPVSTDEYEPSAADDPMLVFDLTDQIRQSIQQTLYSLLVQRRSIFF